MTPASRSTRVWRNPGPRRAGGAARLPGQEPEAVKRFLKAYFRANEQLKTQPDATVAALTELTKLSAADQLEMVKGADWYTAAEQGALLAPGSKVHRRPAEAGRNDGALRPDRQRRRRCASGSTRRTCKPTRLSCRRAGCPPVLCLDLNDECTKSPAPSGSAADQQRVRDRAVVVLGSRVPPAMGGCAVPAAALGRVRAHGQYVGAGLAAGPHRGVRAARHGGFCRRYRAGHTAGDFPGHVATRAGGFRSHPVVSASLALDELDSPLAVVVRHHRNAEVQHRVHGHVRAGAAVCDRSHAQYRSAADPRRAQPRRQRPQVMRSVILPASLPQIFSGFKGDPRPVVDLRDLRRAGGRQGRPGLSHHERQGVLPDRYGGAGHGADQRDRAGYRRSVRIIENRVLAWSR